MRKRIFFAPAAQEIDSTININGETRILINFIRVIDASQAWQTH